MNKNEPILIACEESGIVTKSFIDNGFTNVFSCDMLETSGKYSDRHIVGDVLPILNGRCSFKTSDGVHHKIDTKFSLIIAFPPCTYLSNAGARFLYPKGILNKERYEKGLVAKEFFMKFYNADCKKIAIENPISSTIFGLPKHSQYIQPYEFGHPFKKRTRLWLKGLPRLEPTNIVEISESTKIAGNWFNKGGKERQQNRSKTFPGIAKAMASQWTKKE